MACSKFYIVLYCIDQIGLWFTGC